MFLMHEMQWPLFFIALYNRYFLEDIAANIISQKLSKLKSLSRLRERYKETHKEILFSSFDHFLVLWRLRTQSISRFHLAKKETADAWMLYRNAEERVGGEDVKIALARKRRTRRARRHKRKKPSRRKTKPPLLSFSSWRYTS